MSRLRDCVPGLCTGVVCRGCVSGFRAEVVYGGCVRGLCAEVVCGCCVRGCSHSGMPGTLVWGISRVFLDDELAAHGSALLCSARRAVTAAGTPQTSYKFLFKL